ncbi:hypothetical protein [Leeuwenhoekiella parthenopeia]|uniref:Uncharacterized protein n=1 Tax=Leeuwenhoekiella parthenopeia TaxID=2890320 RepID=A0ABS8GWA3_9FLAO|nr:hypothetical protein [Leeuwenhoekiella parthenopeia]MCC4214264.1 hypothetical protein [Leeuwenhoekiella parthenopeia]
MITVEESYELFSDTLSYLDKNRLEGSDEDLEYFIFEELPGDAVSFLHGWTVDRLIEAKKIPTDVRNDVLNLRTQILEQLEKTRSIEDYRNDLNWELIRDQAEEIKEKIKKKRHHNKTYSLWRVNGCQRGFRSVASFGFGG